MTKEIKLPEGDKTQRPKHPVNGELRPNGDGVEIYFINKWNKIYWDDESGKGYVRLNLSDLIKKYGDYQAFQENGK